MILDNLEIEYHESCAYDSLNILKGDFKVKKLCGARSGEVYKVFGPEVTIRFHTDSNVQERGFVISYEFVTADESK